MVTFEITHSPDEERLGEITLFFENFTLGSDRKSDLLFFDPEIDDIHLVFKQSADGLLIKSTNENSFSSNGKKFKGGKLHKVGDEIKVGSTTIKIKDLVFENLSEKFEVIYKRRLKENPELEPIITQLQKELIFLENNKDV